MPHAKAFLFNLPTELIVVSCAIGQGQLLRAHASHKRSSPIYRSCYRARPLNALRRRQSITHIYVNRTGSLGPSPSVFSWTVGPFSFS